MAPRPPFRGRLPAISRTSSSNDPAISRGHVNRALEDIERELIRGTEHSDVDHKGNSVRGNSNDETVKVTFPTADVPVFVPHSFGYVVTNWTVVDKFCPGDIYRPKGSKYVPNAKGIWLASTAAGCTAKIRLDGQRQKGYGK